MIWIILKILFFQILVAAVVISILKMILSRQLEELAVKKLEYMKIEGEDAATEVLTVVAPGNVPLFIQNKIARICQKKFGHPLKINIKINKGLRGGLVIALKKTIIDYSLIGRLKEAGIIK